MTSSSLAQLAGQVLLGERDLAGLSAGDQRALLGFLQRGKAILFTADARDPSGSSVLAVPALQTEVLAEELDGERRRCDAQRRGLLEAQASLAEAGIPLVLFKTLGPYPYTSSNVDALVPKGALERAVAVLERCGHHEMAHYWEPNKRLLRKFDGARCALIVHLHEKVAWIVLAFMDMNALWSRVQPTDDPFVAHPAPEHVVAVLLAHSVYESNEVGIGDLWKIRQALARPDFDWSEVVRIARLRSWLPGLALARYWYAAAERAAFGDALLDPPPGREALPPLAPHAAAAVDRALEAGVWPVRLSRRVTKPYFFRKLLLDNRRGPLEKTWDLVGLASQVGIGRSGLRRRPASFVCLCGIDGSGKTTHSEAVRAALEECELPTEAVWMRGGYSAAAEWLKRVLRRSSSRIPGTRDAAAKTRVYRRGFTRVLWSWLIAAEQVLAALARIRLPLLRGRTLVAERFVPDTVADLTERFADPRFPARLPARLMRWLTPKPDLILLLDLPGAAAFERKPDDFDATILEERRERYWQALAAYPEVEILDARRPLQDLRQEIVDRVLARVLCRIAEHNPLARQRRNAWE